MMLPAHKPMDPHTFPKFMFNPYHCCPGWETVRPDMRVDTSTPPSSFGSWVHNGRNSYPEASECNNCCMHNHHPPGYYYYTAPYPHIQPPQHAYAYGAHPAYHGAFPYVVPSPYPFEQPRHGYDNSQSYCCGCGDYACQRMENKGVKIEEQKPEVEENGGDSSLVHLPNQHCSAVRLPSNHMKEKGQNKNSESQPAYQKGWNPLGINGHKDFRQPGDGHETMHDRINNSFPWPIFWMPSYNMPEQAMKDLKELNTNAEEKSRKLKDIPMKLLEDVNHAGKSGVPEDEGEVQGRSESLSKKESRTKIIPVKQAEESIEKKLHIEDKLNEEEVQKRNCPTINIKGNGDAKKGTTKSIPVKQAEENSEKTPSSIIKHNEENNKKDGSTKMEKEGVGAKKASGNTKLTPICLRVSPLPRKKSSNSSSPSVSPRQNDIEKIHVDKQVQKLSLKDTNIEVPKKVLKVTDSDVRNEVEKQTNKKQQYSEDAWKNSDSKEALEQQVNQGNNLLSMGAETSTMSGEVVVKRVRDDGNNIEDVVRKTEQCKSSEGMQEGKTLSPADAAVLIQSVYRGFEVRRWKPIQKLRKIFQIRMKMDDVRNQIQDLEALMDHRDKKKMMAVNENIMNLLLQLDTIQGMHQFVREARKSAARELIALQEKLDALAKQADSIEVDETFGSSAVLETSIRNVNLELTVPYDDHNSFQPSDDKVSQDQTTMEEFVQNSSEQESNLETLSRSAEFEVNNKHSSDKTVVSTLIAEQGEAYLPNKKLNPDGNMLCLSNQEPLPEESANPSVSSSIQGNSEVCLNSENDSLPSSVNIMEEDQVLDSQFVLMKQGSLESHQRNEVGASRLDSEEDPQQLIIKSEISSDAQELVEPLCGEEPLNSRNPITEEENNVQEMSELPLAAENEDMEKVVEVDARVNNSDKLHASDANTDHHLSEGVISTNKKSMDILQTDPLISEPGDVIDMENVVDSPVVDRLNKDILGGEVSIKEEAIFTPLESPEKVSQLDIMTPKKQDALESIAVPDSESQSAEEVTECSPLLIKVHQQMIEATAAIPRDGSSGQGIEDGCVFPEHMILAGGTDARPCEESLEISKHHDECACPRDGIPGTEEIKLVEESKSLRLLLENLLEEGRAQIRMIHELSERVKDLEKKLSSQPKKTRTKRYRLMRPCSPKLAS